MSQELVKLAQEKMIKVINGYENELVKLRTGRANPSLLSHIKVDYYGTMTPIMQLANVLAPDANQIVIKPYDKGAIAAIVAAISKSDLGLPAIIEADLVRVNVPQLTEERRKQIVKEMWKETENFKIGIRNERRDINEKIKKNIDLSEDEKKHYENEIQKLTDKYIHEIEQKGKEKEKELLKV